LHGPTLLDAAADVALWASFTGRTTEEPTMHANDLHDLGEAIERRAARVVRTAHELIAAGPGSGDDKLPAWHEVSRKLIADELTSEWLRMHSGRRLKRGETQLLTRMHLQLQDAVQNAIAHVEPALMPATARAAIRACATSVARRR
jgi:hypothetical protein